MPLANHSERITKSLYMAAAIIGAAVFAGWVADRHEVTAMGKGLVTMKPATATTILLCGLAGLIMAARGSRTALGVGVLITPCFPSLSAVGGYVMHIFEDNLQFSVGRGIPSAGTVLAFWLFGAAMIFSGTGLRVNAWWGLAILAIGLIAHVGYLFDAPSLYYFVPEISTAMAVHTALAFELLGAALYLERSPAGPLTDNPSN